MAEATDMIALEAPRKKTSAPATPAVVPIEQRTDVTVEELEKASLPYPAELYNGKVVFKTACPEHGIMQSNITTDINFYLRQNRVGYVMTETNFRLWPERSKESRIPDIAFVRKERLPEDLRHFPAIAPDLAIEIISPEDNFLEMMNKVDAYLEQGAKIVWVVISDTREVLVCTSQNKRSEKEVLRAPELLPGFELPVQKIFEGLPLPDKFPQA